jgi:histidine triad (HIT) family protein
MSSEENCLFCKIIRGEIPCSKVFEDEDLLAFRDIHPIAPVHILIIPKVHISSLNESEEEHTDLLGKLLLRAKKLASDLGISKSGYRTIINTGEDGGQTVFHLHLHLIGGEAQTWPHA